jgi:hypothetical protein
MTSGTAARDQCPGTGAAPHSADTLVFASSDGPVAEVMAHHRHVIRAARDSGAARNVELSGLEADPSSPYCHAVSYGHTGQPLAETRVPGPGRQGIDLQRVLPRIPGPLPHQRPEPAARHRWPDIAGLPRRRRAMPGAARGGAPRTAATTTSPAPRPPPWLPLQPRRRASGAPRWSTPASRPPSTGQRWLSPLRTLVEIRVLDDVRADPGTTLGGSLR